MEKIVSLVIAPIFVGIVIKLFSHWLDEKDNDLKQVASSPLIRSRNE
ncbi:type I toxin-antitoxin system Fst family toxin [Enterococcus gallinarum]|nr:type I toxin-antitoxin system Fst family toxin [Enterococcus gallinarum]MBF0825437.1 type I toxin-antitoxin system Fst family toxin [Enterococcus faecalis]MBF0799040.1 type I toxin-antitoxin system Fst family toxin [Enterococcus gallinarum]MBX8977453.1 type I toxin-antitoxin system Fst family toxin [Enterococcus gallinarum]NYS80589.1 type I toxin-antitoxin system Fst family toxin [Enterococcus gallinarum]